MVSFRKSLLAGLAVSGLVLAGCSSDDNGGGGPNYWPNSFGGPAPDEKAMEPPFPVSGTADRTPYGHANGGKRHRRRQHGYGHCHPDAHQRGARPGAPSHAGPISYPIEGAVQRLHSV